MAAPTRHTYGSVVCDGNDRRLLADGAANALIDYDGACELDHVGVLAMREPAVEPGTPGGTAYGVALGGPLVRRASDSAGVARSEEERLDAVYLLDRDGVAGLLAELIDGAYRAGGLAELDYVLAVMQQTVDLAEQEREQQARASQ